MYIIYNICVCVHLFNMLHIIVKLQYILLMIYKLISVYYDYSILLFFTVNVLP